jgi:hypothetical protein
LPLRRRFQHRQRLECQARAAQQLRLRFTHFDVRRLEPQCLLQLLDGFISPTAAFKRVCKAPPQLAVFRVETNRSSEALSRGIPLLE